MTPADNLRSLIVFGFDSAWTDQPKAPGAICAVGCDRDGDLTFHPPRLVSFAEARAFITSARRGHDVALVALDQPTVVPNATGMRPVDRLAASVVSHVGGGVQPANRGKAGMFCDLAPIWGFLAAVGAVENPFRARSAAEGLFLIEVFPALALPALDARFAGRLAAPKYNPARSRKFRLEHWQAVARSVKDTALSLELPALALWAEEMMAQQKPRKADQDRLDATICALIGIIWRTGGPGTAAMLGDLRQGYMVTPISPAIRLRLEAAAARRGIPFHIAD
ncbi:DUF429 domain-containing protein [Paracoccus sp. (in: a-proteobacteria)]|uniref:DUF429 domain-containing protein n=1 Tax=Paracoccus sp. TaxID=267 RepID=UPI0026E09605|nr:DUF429 domain-containing protein [Paracoccus sp. (in: a-proteobacteria)]MDO5371073.1 DUF429 domain-containing protein [Paracoccus sp. (in: a-proteobacteria)]